MAGVNKDGLQLPVLVLAEDCLTVIGVFAASVQEPGQPEA
jgi:hypothetical protein